MKKIVLLIFPVLVSLRCGADWQYPATKTVDAEDTYFGNTYKDPYRWLENLKDKEVEAWFNSRPMADPPPENVVKPVPLLETRETGQTSNKNKHPGYNDESERSQPLLKRRG